jgi:hypothetical protein
MSLPQKLHPEQMQIKMNEIFVKSKVVELGLVWVWVPTIIYQFVHINIGYLSLYYTLGWYKQIKHNLWDLELLEQFFNTKNHMNFFHFFNHYKLEM